MWTQAARIVAVTLLLSVAVPALPQDDSWTKEIEALIASGRVPQARAAFAAEDSQRRESYPGLLLDARLLAAEQHFQESMNVLARCLAMRRDDAEVYKLVALDAIRLNKFETAASALKDAERLVPGDYLVHFHLGALHYTESRFLDARPELERAVSLQPGYLPAQLFLGLTLEELGGEAGAIDAYRKAIALNEAQPAKSELPYLYLGRLLYRLNRIADAAPLLHQAVVVNPGSAEGWLWLGKACNALGETTEAIAALQRAVAADGRLPEPHYVLSRVYQSQHRQQQSAEELARFRELEQAGASKEDGRRRKP